MKSSTISVILFITILIMSVGCSKDESVPISSTPAGNDTIIVGDTADIDTLITDTLVPVQLSLMDSWRGIL